MGYAYVDLPAISGGVSVMVIPHGPGSLRCLLMSTEDEFREFLAGRSSAYDWFIVQPPYREIVPGSGKWTVVLEGTADAEVALSSAAVPVDPAMRTVLNSHAAQDLTEGNQLPNPTRKELLPVLPVLPGATTAPTTMATGAPLPPNPSGSDWSDEAKEAIGSVIDTISEWGDAVSRFGDSADDWLGAFGSGLADKLGMPTWLRDFFGGFFGELKGTVAGLGDTVSLLWDLLHTTQGWKDLRDSLMELASVDALTNELITTLKHVVAWDDWASGQYAHAVGQIVGELASGGGGKLLKELIRLLTSKKREESSGRPLIVREVDSGDAAKGWNKELMNPAPNTHYIVDKKFHYYTDDIGRVVRVEARLDRVLVDPEKGLRRNQTEQNRIRLSGNPTDQGGHFIGNEFGGPGEGINLFAQLRSQNTFGGRFFLLESEWRSIISGDKKKNIPPGGYVDVVITPEYRDSSTRPISYQVIWFDTTGRQRPPLSFQN